MLGSVPLVGATLLEGPHEPRPAAVKTESMGGTAVKDKPLSHGAVSEEVVDTGAAAEEKKEGRSKSLGSSSERGMSATQSSMAVCGYV